MAILVCQFKLYYMSALIFLYVYISKKPTRNNNKKPERQLQRSVPPVLANAILGVHKVRNLTLVSTGRPSSSISLPSGQMVSLL